MADAEELLAMNLSAEQLAAAVAETTAVVRAGWSEHPHAAIILGTGLGSLAEHITIEAEWDYRDLPHFARSTADGHRGRLLAGRLADVPILAMDGRFHAYEGYSFSQITFPIRVFAELGASFLILSNASGGLNPTLRSGDILLIDDHINLMGPLVGQVFKLPHESLYDPRLLARSEQIANEEAIPLRRGTYIAMLGPNYETRARVLLAPHTRRRRGDVHRSRSARCWRTRPAGRRVLDGHERLSPRRYPANHQRRSPPRRLQRRAKSPATGHQTSNL